VNRPAARVSVEAIAEVKVVTSGYQAEYGRSSGLQINAVTKSGTNQFRGSLYDVERNSKWNSNSKTNILNGRSEAVPEGARLGLRDSAAPSASPAATTSSSSISTRNSTRVTSGNDGHRLPSAHSARAAGRLFEDDGQQRRSVSVHQGSAESGTCSATSQVACFNDGGRAGRIPKIDCIRRD
jgi:hypothetical protein